MRKSVSLSEAINPFQMNIIENQKFEKVNTALSPIEKGEYDSCIFNDCDFSGFNFSGFKFTDCTFTNCNLSLLKTGKTFFQQIKFNNCKMLGIRFDDCSSFGLSFRFEHCTLNHSSFYKTKIKDTSFKNCQLQEVDFTECDASNALFDESDLTGAIFDQSLLEKTDFRTASNFIINPETNKIKKAKFSVNGLRGLLAQYDISVH